jgi:pyruvate,water dikinase
VDEEVLSARRLALKAYRAKPSLMPLVSDEPATFAASDRIEGWAASPGKHRGRVRIVKDLSHTSDLRSGDVLVTSATDPSWTPLFMIAGAIVVERGGPLSHAAIVSRELGVPAVLNAIGATITLREGAWVEVDGSAGTVVVLDETTDLGAAV